MSQLRKASQFKNSLLAIAVTAVASNVMAEGRIEGRVSLDKGVSVEGAKIIIDALNIEATTRRDGSFTMPALPAGEYELRVDYLGSKPKRRQVTVIDDQTLTADFKITAESNMEEILVVGQAAGINKAINKQRAADNILSAVSSDAIGQFPDANVGESLSRMPGVSIERDQGEGRFVRVRGLSPDLNSVTINGSKVTAPGGGGRAVGLDVVPSDLVESLEISKTQTPDKDADALGGSIEVKSLSAFDRDELFYTVSAQASYDDNTGDTSPKVAATASNIFSAFGGENNLGVAASVSWKDRDFGSDNVETGGKWDFEESPAKLEEMEQRHYAINREQLGVGLNIDYKYDANNEYYIRSLYNKRDDQETRNAIVTEFADPLAAGEVGEAEVKRELKDRLEEQEITSIVVGGINRVDAWTFDYAAGFSEATEKKPTYIDGAVFEANDDIAPISFNDTQKPQISALDAFYQADNFELDEVEMASENAKDTEHNIRFDVSRDLLWMNNPTELKFGAKLSRRTKESDVDVTVYSDFPDEVKSLTNYASSEPDYSLGRFGPGISANGIKGALVIAGESEVDLEKSNIDDYNIDEDINAAYGMATIDIDNLRLLAGVRYESTDMTAEGKAFDSDTEEVTATKVSNDYDHWLPALHARYKITDDSIVRAAWTNSVVRPTFEQLSPGRFIDGDDASFGDPTLDPWESSNFDLGYEFYFGAASTASVFLFYKDIDTFVYEAELKDVEGFDKINTFVNGSDADVTGIELAYSQKFSELPAPWNGLLLTANATFADSEAAVSGRNVPLPSQSDVVGNLSVGYENPFMSLRLSGNYKSEYLLEVGESKAFDSYVDSQVQVDLTARFWLTDSVQLFVHGVNLTDEEYYVYNNSTRYNHQYESYGPTYKVGIQLTNF